VDDFVVDADTGDPGEPIGELRRGTSTKAFERRSGNVIQFRCGDPDPDRGLHLRNRECDNPPDPLHAREIGGGFNRHESSVL
jgi:hypothetical protein